MPENRLVCVVEPVVVVAKATFKAEAAYIP